jgi:hypothetical protein
LKDTSKACIWQGGEHGTEESKKRKQVTVLCEEFFEALQGKERRKPLRSGMTSALHPFARGKLILLQAVFGHSAIHCKHLPDNDYLTVDFQSVNQIFCYTEHLFMAIGKPHCLLSYNKIIILDANLFYRSDIGRQKSR